MERKLTAQQVYSELKRQYDNLPPLEVFTRECRAGRVEIRNYTDTHDYQVRWNTHKWWVTPPGMSTAIADRTKSPFHWFLNFFKSEQTRCPTAGKSEKRGLKILRGLVNSTVEARRENGVWEQGIAKTVYENHISRGLIVEFDGIWERIPENRLRV